MLNRNSMARISTYMNSYAVLWSVCTWFLLLFVLKCNFMIYLLFWSTNTKNNMKRVLTSILRILMLLSATKGWINWFFDKRRWCWWWVDGCLCFCLSPVEWTEQKQHSVNRRLEIRKYVIDCNNCLHSIVMKRVISLSGGDGRHSIILLAFRMS